MMASISLPPIFPLTYANFTIYSIFDNFQKIIAIEFDYAFFASLKRQSNIAFLSYRLNVFP